MKLDNSIVSASCFGLHNLTNEFASKQEKRTWVGWHKEERVSHTANLSLFIEIFSAREYDHITFSVNSPT